MAERQYLWLTAESFSDAAMTLVIGAYLVILFTRCFSNAMKMIEPLRVIQCSIYEVQMYACDRYNS